MKAEQLKQLAIDALEDLKVQNLVVLDVRKLTGMTDYMIIGTGTSNRHVKSLADNVELELKKQGVAALGVEGVDGNPEWALVDFGDVVVHVMLPDTRAFYDLERLWTVPAQES